METIKKYWWAIALGVYFMFFNKPAKKRRRRSRRRAMRMMPRRSRRYRSGRPRTRRNMF